MNLVYLQPNVNEIVKCIKNLINNYTFFIVAIHNNIIFSVADVIMYFDYNATTPLAPEAIDGISVALKEHWANPSSGHVKGRNAKRAIDEARIKVAKVINATCDEISFTSGGTEANLWVIHSVVETCHNNEHIPHIVTTNIEHVATELPLKRMRDKGQIEVTFVPVDPKSGAVQVDDIEAAIKSNTKLITVMMANNETGVIQPIKAIGQMLERRKSQRILFHTDAAQAIGKVSVNHSL